MNLASKLRKIPPMNLFPASLGIDFKTNHLILTLVKKSWRKIRLVDYRIYPLWWEDQKEVQEGQWISLISPFISKHQIDKERVSVCIPREKVVVRFLRLPKAAKENLRKVLEYEAPKYTPFDREDFHFDYQILKEDEGWVHLLAVFVKKEELTPYLNLLKRVGITPISIQIPPVAALNLFFYHEGERENGVSVLLDLNGPFLEMNILEGKEWKESFHLPSPKENREEEILFLLKRSNLGEDSVLRSTFFVYGLDASTEDFLPHLGEALGSKEVSAPPTHRIEVGTGKTKPAHIYPSIGLPLKGLTIPRFDLNLLPLELRRKVREWGGTIFVTLILLALILGLTWGAGVYGRYRSELAYLRGEVKKQKPEVEAIESLQKQRKELAAQMEEFNKITRGAVSKVQILRELSQILPSTVWIWHYRFSGKEVEISGFADSASELISLLDKSPLFEKVEFLAPVTKERERRPGLDKERERFKIKMRLEGAGGV